VMLLAYENAAKGGGGASVLPMKT